MSASDDPRRTREIKTVIRGAANKRTANLYIDGQRWAIVEWGGPGRWCIEDNEHLCLDHIENAPGLRGTMQQAIALAEAMIRDGRMPPPEEAKRLAEERRDKQRRQREAWEHPERLYESLADMLELWTDRDQDFVRSNSYRRLCDELIALAGGAIGHFEQVRDNALRALRHIEAEGRSRWYGDDAASARAQFEYAEEHLQRARQIIAVHDPDQAASMPAAPSSSSAEKVIEEARAERTAREARKQREAARDADGSRRARRLAMGRWRRNISNVRHNAELATDDELRWFTSIASGTKNPGDALRLDALSATLNKRWSERSCAESIAQWRDNADRLRRLADDAEGGAA